jgi:hypothetical protein
MYVIYGVRNIKTIRDQQAKMLAQLRKQHTKIVKSERINMVQYGTIWYIMVQYNTIWYNMLHYGTLWYNMVQYGT